MKFYYFSSATNFVICSSTFLKKKKKILMKVLKYLNWLEIFANHFLSQLEKKLMYCCFSKRVNSQFSFFNYVYSLFVISCLS